MSSILPDVVDATRTAASAGAGTPAGTVVLRAAGLRVRGKTVTAAGDAAPAAGELAVFCRPVVTAPAVVRRDGTVLADGWLPDLVRLGELERHLGDGVIEAAVDAAIAEGRLKPRQRRRIMSYPLVIRLMIAMTLSPGGSYCEALARLAGLLADIPFARDWHVPTGKVVTHWRLPVPAEVMEGIFWQAAGPLIGDDEPSAVMLAGMPVGAADGMLVSLADTAANRAMFGSTGTEDNSSPLPQLRIVAVTARAGRAMPGAILGSSRAGEQTLLKRLVKRRPDLFAGRVTCFDRNFPGHGLITAILDAGGHVVARVSATVALPLAEGGGWLPDGSRMTWLNAPSGKKQDRLPVRAAEHNVITASGDGKQEVSETCTVITTLLDHQAAPADAVRDTYLTRWTFKACSAARAAPSAAAVIASSDEVAVTWVDSMERSMWRRAAVKDSSSAVTGTASWRRSARAAAASLRSAAASLARTSWVPVSQAQASWMTRRGEPERRTGPEVRFPAPVIVALSSPNVVSDALHAPGAADRGTARRTRRDTRVPPLPARQRHHHENRLKNTYRTRKALHPRKTETPKVPGVAGTARQQHDERTWPGNHPGCSESQAVKPGQDRGPGQLKQHARSGRSVVLRGIVGRG